MTEWLVDTLIATSALMLLVLVLREPVRRRFGPSAAYSLWLLPAARAMTPTVTVTVERAVPAISATDSFLLPQASGGAIAPVPLAEPTLLQGLVDAPSLMMLTWLAVAIWLFANRTTAYWRQRRAILESGQQLARLGSVRLVRSAAVSGPVAFGLFDRVIAVPADFDRRYDDGERRLALDHELAHHRSGDLVANAFAFVLLCLQWFNPLAWWSHAAFRFDQEAACDARVLDKADPGDRAAYGRAIAKAASGRALLFASALDRPHTLHRRLKSMLFSPTPRRRAAGQLAVLGLIAVALPLTASRAIEYIDVPQPPAAPLAPAAPKAPAAPVVPAAAPAAPVAVVAPVAAPLPPSPPAVPRVPDIGRIGNHTVQIHGRTVRWEELTPEERSEIRADLAEAERELARSHVEMERDLAEARAEMEKFRNGEFRREMAEARREVARALAEVEANADELRRAGEDPERIKDEVRKSLKEVESMDIDRVVREALASIDPAAMKAAMAQAHAEIRQAQERLDRAGRAD